MEGNTGSFGNLLNELQDHVVSCLDPNDVACSLRLICKAAAARYSGPQHTRIRLAQRVPTHAFARRWGHPEAMRSLPRAKRKRLMRLTAASGSIPNLQLLLPLAACALDSDESEAAASTGQLAMCQWLRQNGCPLDRSALQAAGRSGSRALCDWLIAVGCPGGAGSASGAALAGAACAGHMGLVDQLLASYGPPEEPGEVLAAAAYGCDLPALVRLRAALRDDATPPLDMRDMRGLWIDLASSALPDWREKLEWLEAQGCSCHSFASLGAALCPDALERLTWLAERGWPLNLWHVVNHAAARGDVAALQFALDARRRQGGPDAEAGVRQLADKAVRMAAGSGHLAVLQHLHAHGYSLERARLRAATRGRQHVVAWLVETLGAEAVLSSEVFEEAAGSSSLPLLSWLRERGCVWRDACVINTALKMGCSEEVLDWLLAQGCEVQLQETRWADAAYRGDLASLARLRRLGCPWAADGVTFTQAAAACSPLPALRWLAEAGCPVDWGAVMEELAGLAGGEWLAALDEVRRQHLGLAG